jgi:hypothetical protein
MKDKLLAFGLTAALILFSLLTLFLIIRPAYLPYLPITQRSPETLGLAAGDGTLLLEEIRFVNFEVGTSTPKAGQVLPVTLYWQALSEPNRDYLIRLCLHDNLGTVITCHQGYPAQGRYPTRAWEADYLIKDEAPLALPHCLIPAEYELRLSVYPLRRDQARSTVDRNATSSEAKSLGKLLISAADNSARPEWLVCLGRGCAPTEELVLQQLQQTMTIIQYKSFDQLLSSPNLTRLVTPDRRQIWLPMEAKSLYTCPNEQIVLTQHFILDPTVDPGTYQVEIDGQLSPIPKITVNTRDRVFQTPEVVQVEASHLFGQEIIFLGFEADLSSRLPGETLEIITYWQALQLMTTRYFASVHLLDNHVEMWSQDDNPVGDGYMNILWSPGEVISDVHALRLKEQTPPGLYNIELGLYSLESGDFDFLPVSSEVSPASTTPNLMLGRVRILDPDHAKTPQYPLQSKLAEQIWLKGYDLPDETLAPDLTIDLTLYWETQGKVPVDYTVFTQLIGPDGRVWAQQDNQPQQGRYPTTVWGADDRIVDRYTLQVQPDAPQGTYQLITGMYDINTGQRLEAVDQQGQRHPQDAILLKTLPLTPQNNG